jgi:peptide/nickel transport system substrate-binding protein
MKKLLVFVLVLALCMTALTGCASKPATEADQPSEETPTEQGQEAEAVNETLLSFADGGALSNLEPYNYSGTITGAILRHMFSTLVATDADRNMGAALAESYEQIDGMTFEFKLRQDVTFHNGEKFDANTVKYSVERALDKDLEWRLASDFAFIESVEIIDDYTVRIKSYKPYGDFLLKMSALLMVPEQYITEIGHENFAAAPIGTGPYKFISWEKDGKLVMEAYEDYFGGAADIKTIEFRTIPEESTRIAALEAGEIDLISNVPFSQIDRLKNNPDIEVAIKPTIRVIFTGFNMTYDGPLQDKRVRQALNYAVDVDAIVNSLFKGETNSVATIMADSFFGYNPDVDPYGFDLDKAKALLKEAGYEDGLTLNFAVNGGRQMNNREVAQIIVAQLGQAGVTVNIIEKENGLFTTELKAGEIEDLYFMGIGGGYASCELISRISFGTGERYSVYSNEAIDNKRIAASTAMTAEEAEQSWFEYQEMIKEEAPALFLYQEPSVYAYNKKLKNFEPRMDQMILGYGTSIEE